MGKSTNGITHKGQSFDGFCLLMTPVAECPVLTASRHCMNSGQLVAACSIAIHVPRSCTTKYLQEIVKISNNTKSNALQRYNQSHEVPQYIGVAAEKVDDAEACERQVSSEEFNVENCQNHWR